MIIHGREIGFLLTIGASAKISELCPDGDLSRLDEVLSTDSYTKQIVVTATIIAELNKAYESAKKYDDPDYKPNPLSVDEVMSLEPNEFSRLSKEAVKAFQRDTKQSVEVSPPKKEQPAIETN